MDTQYIRNKLIDLMHQAQHLFSKDGWVGHAALVTWLYFAPIQHCLVGIGVLVVADVMTGIWASFAQGEFFSTKRLGKGLIQKSALYLIIMATSFQMGVLMGDMHWLSVIFALIICAHEFSSVVENMVVINPDMAYLRTISGFFQKVVDRKKDQALEAVVQQEQEQIEETEKEISNE